MNALLSVHSAAGDASAAERVFRCERVQPTTGLRAPVSAAVGRSCLCPVSFPSCAHPCPPSHISEALQLQPDVITMQCMMEAMGRAGHWADGLRCVAVLRRWQRAGASRKRGAGRQVRVCA